MKTDEGHQLLSHTGRILLGTGEAEALPGSAKDTSASPTGTAVRQNADVPARIYYGGYGMSPGIGYGYGYGGYGSYGYGAYQQANQSDGGFYASQLEGQYGQPPYQYQLSNSSTVPAGNLNRTAAGAYSQWVPSYFLLLVSCYIVQAREGPLSCSMTPTSELQSATYPNS